MESETLDISEMKNSSSSSWPISRGSLDDVVTCESSISDVSDADHAARRTPLIMRRPSPDSGPCEITIVFTQLHEIKQVYIRSTAKVYEIYCATNEKNDNEYLCTVRCGLATRDEQLELSDAVRSSSTTSSGSNRSVDEAHSRSGSESSSNEDGWVDVKLNKARIDSGNTSLKGDIQDLYEATAEISDGDPVMCITLRLLSIQSGDYVYIDEVYVFADPVESADNSSSAPSLETSSGSAMLSMFIPTLMQLSKSRMSKVQEDSGSAAGERKMSLDTEQHSTGGAATSTNVVQTEALPSTVLNGASVHQPNHLLQTPNPQNQPQFTYRENDFPCSKIEKTLDILVSRVSKMEDFCMRFEESMLKPIIRMEARLERVELQLESFMKNQQLPRIGCTRFSAPEFSGNESESNSTCADGSNCPSTSKSESSKKDCRCKGTRFSAPEFSSNESESNSICTAAIDCSAALESESSKKDGRYFQALSVPTSTSASQLLTGLIISAPDFSYTDEEEEVNSIEAVNDSAIALKKPMSIDDALASALAGFITSALTEPSERTVKVEEAELLSGGESGSTSPSALSAAVTEHLECTEMVKEAENLSCIEGSGNTTVAPIVHIDDHPLPSVSINGGNASSDDARVAEKISLAVVSGGEETAIPVDGDNHTFFEEGIKTCSDCSSVDGLGETEKRDSIAGIGCTESGDGGDQTFVTDHSSTTIVSLSKYVCVSGSGAAPEDNIDYSSRKSLSDERHAVLQDIIELPSPNIVDFSVPVLDVKFSSLGNSFAKSLESLLVDMPDLAFKAPLVKEDDGSSTNEQYELVVIENEEPRDPEGENELLCVDDYKSVYMPSGAEVQDPSNCGSLDMNASLI